MFAMTALYRARLVATRAALRLMGGGKPTTVIGADASLKLCKMITGLGLRKVMIVTDKPLLDLGMIDGVRSTLETLGAQVTIFDGVKPDPTYDVVREGLNKARGCDADAVLAIGGGSSIDAAKIICACVTNNKDPKKLVGILKVRKRPLPLFVVLTTAGTGSETTIGAVVSDDLTHKKGIVIDSKIMPLIAALDPVMMKKLPAPITAATGMDALTHAIEAHISTFATDETRFYTGAATRLLLQNLPKACGSESEDLDVRENMAVASYYAGLGISMAHVGSVHAIAHQLGAKYGIPHGLANAVVLPFILELYKDAAKAPLAELARISGIGSITMSDVELANAFIGHIKNLNREIGIPAGFDKIKRQDIADLASDALTEGNAYPVPAFMTRHQCESILARMMSA